MMAIADIYLRGRGSLGVWAPSQVASGVRPPEARLAKEGRA